MKQFVLLLFFCCSIIVYATDEPGELHLEFYIDSIFEENDIDYPIAHAEFLLYAKKNYKGVRTVQEFLEFSVKKMKSKEKEYSKYFTREFHELHAFALMAYKHLPQLEATLYDILSQETKKDNKDFVTILFMTIHEMNYWELNCYKPNHLGVKLGSFYSNTENFDLVEKINLFILAAKIYKASYFVNPMHICESRYAKTEIVMDVDSLNLKTNNITIDSIPSGIKPPIFIGGRHMLDTYVQNNLKYPEKAIRMGHEGRVLVSFKVDESGTVYDTKIKKSPSEFLSKEVIRIVESLPQWQPDVNTKKGAGFTKFTMPFDFKLPEEK